MAEESVTGVKELSLEEGVQEAMRLLGEVSERPILVAMYGFPSSNIAQVSSEILSRCREKGLSVAYLYRVSNPSIFETIRDAPDVLKDVILMCGSWERTEPVLWTTLMEQQDPTPLVEGIANRQVNLHIGVYNSRHGDLRPAGVYDIIICTDPNFKERSTLPNP